MGLRVAPFTGAWIEICYTVLGAPSPGVAPFTGAWIEIANFIWAHPTDASLPSRERGLKLR